MAKEFAKVKREVEDLVEKYKASLHFVAKKAYAE